ncbi:MAG: DUF4286 family protein [Bacteroidia bacterium]|nr:DUF4286 family protein [Bacteroidia bacterium]
MLLYNETIGIDKDIEKEWLEWMNQVYIPDIMATEVFVDYKFYKVLTHDDEGSVSYCVQYFTPSIEKFNHYLAVVAPSLAEKHHQKFKDRHVAFRTLLEGVE